MRNPLWSVAEQELFITPPQIYPRSSPRRRCQFCTLRLACRIPAFACRDPVAQSLEPPGDGWALWEAPGRSKSEGARRSLPVSIRTPAGELRSFRAVRRRDDQAAGPRRRPRRPRDAALLGGCVLPGGVADPRRGIEQARRVEEAGLGTVWIGEASTPRICHLVAGAVGQATAGFASVPRSPTPFATPWSWPRSARRCRRCGLGGWSLGFGRSAMWRWQAYGTPAPTLSSLGDTADILRRLWAGETVCYDGSAGTFPNSAWLSGWRCPHRPSCSPRSVQDTRPGRALLRRGHPSPLRLPRGGGSFRFEQSGRQPRSLGHDPAHACNYYTTMVVTTTTSKDAAISPSEPTPPDLFHVAGLGRHFGTGQRVKMYVIAHYILLVFTIKH